MILKQKFAFLHVMGSTHMKKVRIGYLIAYICQLWTITAFGDTVTICLTSHIPAIQFAVDNLKEAIENEGDSCTLLSTLEMPQIHAPL